MDELYLLVLGFSSLYVLIISRNIYFKSSEAQMIHDVLMEAEETKLFNCFPVHIL